MATRVIPDDELLSQADRVTIWVASLHAPIDVWSLAEAVSWVMLQPDRAHISLFRPPDKQVGAAWVGPDQIKRLALALQPDNLPSAA